MIAKGSGNTITLTAASLISIVEASLNDRSFDSKQKIRVTYAEINSKNNHVVFEVTTDPYEEPST